MSQLFVIDQFGDQAPVQRFLSGQGAAGQEAPRRAGSPGRAWEAADQPSAVGSSRQTPPRRDPAAPGVAGERGPFGKQCDAVRANRRGGAGDPREDPIGQLPGTIRRATGRYQRWSGGASGERDGTAGRPVGQRIRGDGHATARTEPA